MMWHLIDTVGPNPGAISHHSALIYNDKMWVFGGSGASGMQNETRYFYALDMRGYRWEVV